MSARRPKRAAPEGVGCRVGQPVVIVVAVRGRVRRFDVIGDLADAIVIFAVGVVILVSVIHHLVRRVVTSIHHHAGRLVAIVVVAHRQPSPAISTRANVFRDKD